MTSKPPFPFGDRVGLILLVETSLVSGSAILLLLSYIAYSAVSIKKDSPKRWRIEGAAEIFFLNQLAWDLLQALGGAMNIKWAIDASVHGGPFCSAQGAVKQASDVGAALSTLIIAIYTIKTLCFSGITDNSNSQVIEDNNTRRRGLLWGFGTVTVLCVVVSLLVGINIAADGSSRFYGPTGLWCWIQPHYSVQRTVADFLFMWITAGCNIVIYIILFFWFKGNIIIDGWRPSLSRRPKPIDIKGPRKQAYGLLFYPLVYTVAVLPVSAARYRTFAHHHVPYSATFAVDVIYLSNGLFNVLLFSITRPFLLPHDLPGPDVSGSMPENPPEIVVPDNDRPPMMSVHRHLGPQRELEGNEAMRWSTSVGTSYAASARNRSTEALV